MEMGIIVKRYKRRVDQKDENSPSRYYLRQAPGTCRTCTIETIASEIETLGTLSSEDVTHSMKAFVRKLRENLIKGNRVKVDGLGTFYLSFSTEGTEEEKDCTVKNIDKVHIRFMVENTLRLVNDSTATTRKAPNNVVFILQGILGASDSAEGEESGEEGEGEAPN